MIKLTLPYQKNDKQNFNDTFSLLSLSPPKYQTSITCQYTYHICYRYYKLVIYQTVQNLKIT